MCQKEVIVNRVSIDRQRGHIYIARTIDRPNGTK